MTPIVFEVCMYNTIFSPDALRYMSMHSTVSLFLNPPLGKRLRFSPFRG